MAAAAAARRPKIPRRTARRDAARAARRSAAARACPRGGGGEGGESRRVRLLRSCEANRARAYLKHFLSSFDRRSRRRARAPTDAKNIRRTRRHRCDSGSTPPPPPRTYLYEPGGGVDAERRAGDDEQVELWQVGRGALEEAAGQLPASHMTGTTFELLSSGDRPYAPHHVPFRLQHNLAAVEHRRRLDARRRAARRAADRGRARRRGRVDAVDVLDLRAHRLSERRRLGRRAAVLARGRRDRAVTRDERVGRQRHARREVEPVDVLYFSASSSGATTTTTTRRRRWQDEAAR